MKRVSEGAATGRVDVIETKVRKANVADPEQGRMKRASKGAVTRRVELNETKVRKANVAEPDEGEGKERREKKIGDETCGGDRDKGTERRKEQ
jgi:hypothetical protein